MEKPQMMHTYICVFDRKYNDAQPFWINVFLFIITITLLLLLLLLLLLFLLLCYLLYLCLISVADKVYQLHSSFRVFNLILSVYRSILNELSHHLCSQFYMCIACYIIRDPLLPAFDSCYHHSLPLTTANPIAL